jgi:hypothetical protein
LNNVCALTEGHNSKLHIAGKTVQRTTARTNQARERPANDARGVATYIDDLEVSKADLAGITQTVVISDHGTVAECIADDLGAFSRNPHRVPKDIHEVVSRVNLNRIAVTIVVAKVYIAIERFPNANATLTTLSDEDPVDLPTSEVRVRPSKDKRRCYVATNAHAAWTHTELTSVIETWLSIRCRWPAFLFDAVEHRPIRSSR